MTAGDNISTFAAELIDRYGEEIRQEAWSCPWCGGQLRKLSGAHGEFYGCSNYKSQGCRYTRKIYGKSGE